MDTNHIEKILRAKAEARVSELADEIRDAVWELLGRIRRECGLGTTEKGALMFLLDSSIGDYSQSTLMEDLKAYREKKPRTRALVESMTRLLAAEHIKRVETLAEEVEDLRADFTNHQEG